MIMVPGQNSSLPHKCGCERFSRHSLGAPQFLTAPFRLAPNPARGGLFIGVQAFNQLFVFQRRGSFARPTSRKRFWSRSGVYRTPPPPAPEKQKLSWIPLLYNQATPSGVSSARTSCEFGCPKIEMCPQSLSGQRFDRGL